MLWFWNVQIRWWLTSNYGFQGGEKYQQAYYVYEELAQAPSTSTPSALIGQAVAELHLGRLPEAEVALQQALEKDPKHADALANMIVLSILAGKESNEFNEHLKWALYHIPLLWFLVRNRQNWWISGTPPASINGC